MLVRIFFVLRHFQYFIFYSHGKICMAATLNSESFVVQTFQLYDAIYTNRLSKLHKYWIKKQTIAFINKIWQHNIISTSLHQPLSPRTTRKSQSVKSTSFNEIWMTDRSVFTQAVRNYETFLSEYANKKKYKINIIKHS